MILRIQYIKTSQGRFMSHLDLVRTMQRAFQRAKLPLAYSEGFNPHPRISYGSALAVGVTSEGEYLDLELRENMNSDEVRGRLEEVLPPGLKLRELQEIKPGKESLSAAINMAQYQVEVPLEKSLSQEEVNEVITWVMAQPSLVVTRRGKKGPRSLDIREGICSLKGWMDKAALFLQMDLQMGSQGNVKPEEVVGVIREHGLEPMGARIVGNYRIHRLGLYIRQNNELKTPLEV